MRNRRDHAHAGRSLRAGEAYIDPGGVARRTVRETPTSDSRWFAGWNPRGAEAVRRLRETLTELDPVATAPLVESLNDLETCATLPKPLP